jgi:hypothetical protein
MRLLLVEDNLEISEVMTVYCGIKKDIDCKVVGGSVQGLLVLIFFYELGN